MIHHALYCEGAAPTIDPPLTIAATSPAKSPAPAIRAEKVAGVSLAVFAIKGSLLRLYQREKCATSVLWHFREKAQVSVIFF
jgi:hypothetical protein